MVNGLAAGGVVVLAGANVAHLLLDVVGLVVGARLLHLLALRLGSAEAGS